jgi:hypothetical protein
VRVPADLNLRHLDGDQRRRGLQPVSRPDSQAVDAMCRPSSATGLNAIHQEAIMNRLIRGAAIIVASSVHHRLEYQRIEHQCFRSAFAVENRMGQANISGKVKS